ncbi:MAG: hypothetical protein KDB37_10560 [Ilumatobacter sp.]|nr:hypothetical protein [Ilumatobacter sp.]
MTERELAEMLRRVDDDAPLDDHALRFKAQLRDDLAETLDHECRNRARLAAVEEASAPHPWRGLAGAAALVAIVVGIVMIVAVRSTDSPPSPAATAPTTATATTVPVLGPAQACERFRSSVAFGLLTAAVPDDVTVEDIDASVAQLDVLIADVGDDPNHDELRTAIRSVRNALNEAGLLLEAGEGAGSESALQASRIEFAGIARDGAFGTCFGP